MMINSPPLHSNSNKRLRFSIPRNKDNDLLINSTSEKFEDINNNHYRQEKNSINCNNTMKQEILVSNTNTNNNNNENDTTLLTTTTTMTTVEFKVKTTKTSSRKRKSNVINDMNNDNINKEQPVSKKKKNQRMIKNDDELNNNKKKKSNSKTNDQSSSTDESSFGSCEPGTNVVLQGIVWNETDKGVLVVNITWRGKTYVGALLNTTEQNWAPPRYKSDIRSTIKQNHNRDHQLTSTYETTERILRNGKRRCSTTATVIPNSTTKIDSFKMPEIPPTKIDDNTKIIEKFIIPSSNNNHDEDEINLINEEKNLRKTLSINGDEELGDNYSSRSISPITSGTSTTSSSPLLSNNIENQSSIPIDLSNSKIIMNIEQNKSNSIVQQSSNDTLIPYHFTNDMLYSTSSNSSDYFSSLQNSTNSFNLASFNKQLSSVSSSSSSSYHSIPTQVYLNPSNYSSLSKSSH
ncbi:unnamed protein product [Rotaria sp. Silwood2]|nr:unnamed protein product [Rotaria sp. Silwood2]CAF4066225.1 unnamed protein product [Rotaria sp. Silwood2]